MAATISMDTSTDAPAGGDGLFAGISFFVLQRVPLRSTYIDRIQQHGGQIVKTESHAHVILSDHVRKDAPDGSLSYTFIDAALAAGNLPDYKDHTVRRAPSRPVGSVGIPAKSTRTAFTREDDLCLWEWVMKAERDGLSIKGNDVYKELAAINNRHTWQSWRDRYVKILAFHPPAPAPAEASLNASTTAPSAPPRASMPSPQNAARESNLRNKIHKRRATPKKSPEPDLPEGYTEEDIEKLLANGRDIANVDEDKKAAAWSAWAESPFSEGAHTAEEWAVLWEYVAKPRYDKMREERKRRSQATRMKVSTDTTGTKSPAQPAPPILEPVSEPTQAPSVALEPSTKGVAPADDVTMEDPETFVAPKRKSVEDEPEEQDRAKRSRTEDPTTASAHITQHAASRTTSLPPIPTFASDFERSKRRLFGFPSPEKAGTPFEDAVMSDNHETMRAPHVQQHTSQEQTGANQEPEIKQEDQEMNQLEDSYAREDSEEPQISEQDGYARKLQSREGQDMDLSDRGSSHSLTEANLASHTERYRERSTRAADLPEDDESKDQTEFLEFLQKAAREATSRSNGVSKDRQVPSFGLAASGEPQLDRPVMSDEEIDDVFEQNKTWPWKPQEPQTLETVKPAKRPNNTAGAQGRNDHAPNDTNATSVLPRHDEDDYTPRLNGEKDEDRNAPLQSQPTVFQTSARETDRLRPTNYRKATAREQDVEEEVEAGRRQVSAAPSVGQKLPGHIQDEQRQLSTAPSVGQEMFDIPSASGSSSPYASPVMSRPQLLDTQGILDMETQQDEFGGAAFDIPLPEDSPPLSQMSESDQLSEMPDHDPFDIPLPPSSPEDAFELQRSKEALLHQEQQRQMSTPSRKRVASQKVQSQSAEELEDGDVDEYITLLQVRDGYTEADIVEALRRTSMRPELAELALAEHAAGRGWPDDVPGIWSEEEDAIVMGTSGAEANRVAAKMTSDEVLARMNFLENFLEKWEEASS